MGRGWTIGVLGAAIVAAGLVLASPWSSQRDPSLVRAVAGLEGQWVGGPAEPFQLPGMDGQTHSLSEYRGKVVFLNFWASFCKPCRREMPSMERLVRQYRKRGLEMVAVSLDAEQADMRGFMREFLPGDRTAMDVLWDASGKVSQAYGTEKIPETYIIDRDGRIVARFVGEYDWTRPEVKQLIEALL